MYQFKEVKKGTFVLSLDNHVDLAPALIAFCADNNIYAGYITGLGAVSSVTLRFLDPVTLKYVDRCFEEQMEITNLTGNISSKDGRPYLHLHITLGRSDYSCIGGHLLTGTINGACELVVEAYENTTIGRYTDPETGLNLYKF